MTTDTTATPTPWPTRDQVIAALGTMADRTDLHPNWQSALGRLREHAERHTALRAAGELLERERQALTGEPPNADPVNARPSAELAVFDAIAKVGELEHQALCRYACCAQAALELAAAASPASWHEPLPGETPPVDADGRPRLPAPGEEPGELRLPEALEQAPGVEVIGTALQGFAALAAAHEDWQDTFGCNEACDELEEGCGGGPHISEHEIDYAHELERVMDHEPDCVADYADAVAWTLTHGLRDRLRAPAGRRGEGGTDG